MPTSGLTYYIPLVAERASDHAFLSNYHCNIFLDAGFNGIGIVLSLIPFFVSTTYVSLSHAILFCPWERHFTALSHGWCLGKQF